MQKKNEDETISLQGYSVDILKELSRSLGFTYEMYPSPDGFYGTVTENGTWNGMIRQILDGVISWKVDSLLQKALDVILTFYSR